MDLFRQMDAPLAGALRAVLERVRALGGRGWLVGGAVRDALLGRALADLDVEVYGVPPDRLEAGLGEVFALSAVGRSFGVLKLRRWPIDVSVPRRETKRGSGHQGFLIESDPVLSPAEAAARRDFTVNAILADPLTGELLDPWGGVGDLRARRLRHVSEKFAEDPLRVLRGMQFAARFELVPDPSTVALCRGLGPEGLARERQFEEWRKLVVKGTRPSLGLDFLRATGWLRLYPELAALPDCPQDPGWHPEGDVWAHTLHCLDAMAARRVGDPWEDAVVGFAVLCHDLGKAFSTVFAEGRWRSPGHDQTGVPLTEAFLRRLTDETALIEGVKPLVAAHMRPSELAKARAGAPAVRRLARAVGRLDRLERVVRADHGGRPPLPPEPCRPGDWLAEQAAALALERAAPQPLVQGRHLVERGHAPGPAFKAVLADCFEAQLDGAFEDLPGGLAYLDRRLAERPLGG